MKKSIEMPSYESLIQMLEYKDGKVFWKKRTVDSFKNEKACNIWNANWAGKEAGGPNTKGYLRLAINYKKYYVHRIIWVMHHRNLSSDVEIDHKDGNPINNSIDNLRVATTNENTWNQLLRQDNTSGFKGVDWSEQKQKWRARVQVNKTVHCKFFDMPLDAARWAQEERKILHGKFANHGV